MKFKEGREPVIVAYARTPFTSLGGELADISPIDFSAQCVMGLLERARLSPTKVTDLVVGNVLQAGLGQLPAKQIALKSGLSESAVCSSINAVCSSSMEAVASAAKAVYLDPDKVIVAGGFESMSQAVYATEGSVRGSLLPKLSVAKGAKASGDLMLQDLLSVDGLTDFNTGLPMGCLSEYCAAMDNVSRELQDAYCVASYRRAQEAMADGSFELEIVPVRKTQLEADQVTFKDKIVNACCGPHKVLEGAMQKERPLTFASIASGIGRVIQSPLSSPRSPGCICLDDGPTRLDETKVPQLRGSFTNWWADLDKYGLTDKTFGMTIDADAVFATRAPARLETRKRLAELKRRAAAGLLASTHTAANSSKLTDGAAFVVVVSRAFYESNKAAFRAGAHGQPISIKAVNAVGVHPTLFPIAPSLAAGAILKDCGMSVADVQRIEINEAFASIAIANALRIGLSADELVEPSIKRVNASGGAVSLGHPLGASGARLVVTLCRQLGQLAAQNRPAVGLGTICNGGGGASAIVLETLCE